MLLTTRKGGNGNIEYLELKIPYFFKLSDINYRIHLSQDPLQIVLLNVQQYLWEVKCLAKVKEGSLPKGFGIREASTV